jgi:hypothetical protein
VGIGDPAMQEALARYAARNRAGVGDIVATIGLLIGHALLMVLSLINRFIIANQ